MSEKVSVAALREIDADLYERLEKIVDAKGLKMKTKKAVLTYVLEDYANIYNLHEFNNPYLIDHIRSIIDAACKRTENHLGGRLTKLSMENAINLGILNRIILDYFNKYEDKEEVHRLLNRYRQEAVEDLQHNVKPKSYSDLLKEHNE